MLRGKGTGKLSGFVSRVSVQVLQNEPKPVAVSRRNPGQRGRGLLILMGLWLLIAVIGLIWFGLTVSPSDEKTAPDPITMVRPEPESVFIPDEVPAGGAVGSEPALPELVPPIVPLPKEEPVIEPPDNGGPRPHRNPPTTVTMSRPVPASRPTTVAGSVGKPTPGAGKSTGVVTNTTNVGLHANVAIGAGSEANLGSVNLGSVKLDRVDPGTVGIGTSVSTVVRDKPPEQEETPGNADSVVESVLPIFPWPPKDPSSLVRLDVLYDFSRNGEASLQGVARQLAAALRDSGYLEQSFYRAPGGFVMVTRLEGIAEDGSPLGEDRRYRLPDDRRDFSFAEYISHLFFAPQGYYRFVAFVVTDRPYTTSEEALSESAALGLLRRGAVALPSAFAQIPFSPDHRVDALIYEFRQASQGVETIRPGRLPPRTHLEKSGMTSALGGATK